MRYLVLILGLGFAACSNGESLFGQFDKTVEPGSPFGQQTVGPGFTILFPTEGGVAGVQPQIRWGAAEGGGPYELSVWRDASLTDLADFQRTSDTEAVVRVPLEFGSEAFAEVRARGGSQTTGIVRFCVGQPCPDPLALTLGPAEGNRLASLSSPEGSALALLDMAGNATWLHTHAGPGAILDARVLPHGVVYVTDASAHEVGWDGLPLWEGPAGSFVDGPGMTTLVDAAGLELGAWQSQGPGAPAEAVSPLAGYEVAWAVTTQG